MGEICFPPIFTTFKVTGKTSKKLRFITKSIVLFITKEKVEGDIANPVSQDL